MSEGELNIRMPDITTHLENNDSYEALKMAEDLIVIGATGTNVADLQLLIVGNSQT